MLSRPCAAGAPLCYRLTVGGVERADLDPRSRQSPRALLETWLWNGVWCSRSSRPVPSAASGRSKAPMNLRVPRAARAPPLSQASDRSAHAIAGKPASRPGWRAS